jgi:hypothetical protein
MKARLLLAALVSFSCTAFAAQLTFEATDPLDDTWGPWTPPPIDLVRTVLTFDNTTGNYTIEVVASAANPFRSTFRLNWNSWNETQGNNFFDNVNDFDLGAGTQTSVFLNGNDPVLMTWQEGDVVFLNSAGSASPIIFGNGVLDFPFVGSFAGDDFPEGGNPITGTSTDVPDHASTLALLWLSAAGLAFLRRSMPRRVR